MKYSEARGKIKSGDILAWTHKSWKSWYDIKIQMIRIFTRSEYCHVGVAWVIAGRVFVLEAVTPLIRIYPLSKELPFYWIPTEIDWNKDAEEFAMNCVGDPYSQFEAILASINGLDIGQNQKWQCAEYLIQIYKKAGIDLKCLATPSGVIECAQKTLNKPIYIIEAN